MFFRNLFFLFIILFASSALASNAGGGVVPGVSLGTSASATNPQRSGQAGTGVYSDTTGQVIIAGLSNSVLDLIGVTSAVDYLSITNGVTGAPGTVSISATGTDTNINLNINPKGTGAIITNNFVGIGTTSAAFALDVRNNSTSNPPVNIVNNGNTTFLPIMNILAPNMSTALFLSFGKAASNGNSGNYAFVVGSPSYMGLGIFGQGTALRVDTNGHVLIGPNPSIGATCAIALCVQGIQGDNIATFTATTSEANFFDFTGGITGTGPTILATGTDTNVGLNIAVKGTGTINAKAPFVLKAFTVATLPTGTTGATAYVSDAIACTFMATLTGGGAVACPVFYNGTAWVGN